MLRLIDVVDVPHVAALLSAWLAPKDMVALVVWAIENELHDVAGQWVTLWIRTSDIQESDAWWALLVRCASAAGCRVAFTRLRRCGSIENYITKIEVASEGERERLPASVVHEAAKRGDLATLQWLCARAMCEPHEAMAYAAANGHVEAAQWIGSLGAATREVEIHHIEVGGTLRVLAWTARGTANQFINYFSTASYGLAPVQRTGDRGYVGAMDIVAQEGDVAMLSAMHEDPDYDWSCTSSAMDSAASRGHLPVLEWLIQHRSEGCTQAAMDGAARHGHLRVMQRLREHQSLTTDIAASTVLAALEGGQLDVLCWMHAHLPHLWTLSPTALMRYRLVEAACVAPNRLRMLRWLDDTKDIRLATQTAMSFVLSQGDVEAAQWLADPMEDGALLAHWDWVVAKWMSYEFALWHSNTFAKAALNGHLHIIKWLAHAGSFHKVDADTLWQCAMRGHLDVVAFVLQRPQHHAKDLVFLPREWSSFYDAMKDSGHHTVCEWDRLACDPTWARQYVQLWLLYRPTKCKRVAWLAKWARHCGHGELIRQLHNEKNAD